MVTHVTNFFMWIGTILSAKRARFCRSGRACETRHARLGTIVSGFTAFYPTDDISLESNLFMHTPQILEVKILEVGG